MLQEVNLAGSFTLPGRTLSVNRMGYGAMQLAGGDGDKLVGAPLRCRWRDRSLARICRERR
jgi:pyridoxine 4-dehydrogenase